MIRGRLNTSVCVFTNVAKEKAKQLVGDPERAVVRREKRLEEDRGGEGDGQEE